MKRAKLGVAGPVFLFPGRWNGVVVAAVALTRCGVGHLVAVHE